MTSGDADGPEADEEKRAKQAQRHRWKRERERSCKVGDAREWPTSPNCNGRLVTVEIEFREPAVPLPSTQTCISLSTVCAVCNLHYHFTSAPFSPEDDATTSNLADADVFDKKTSCT